MECFVYKPSARWHSFRSNCINICIVESHKNWTFRVPTARIGHHEPCKELVTPNLALYPCEIRLLCHTIDDIAHFSIIRLLGCLHSSWPRKRNATVSMRWWWWWWWSSSSSSSSLSSYSLLETDKTQLIKYSNESKVNSLCTLTNNSIF